MNLKLYLICLFLLIFSFSCKKKIGTDESIALKSQDDNVTKINKIIRDNLQLALNTGKGIDTNTLIQQVKSSTGLSGCHIASKGHCMIVVEKDGAVLNFLLDSKKDSVAYNFKLSNVTPPQKVNSSSNRKDFSYLPPVYPSGKRVLILAPFQWQFQQDLPTIMTMFKKVGFSVDTLLNEHVTTAIFQSDRLQDYDVVVIETHGAAAVTMLNGNNGTGLLTGEIVNQQTIDNFNADEKQTYSDGIPLGQTTKYFAITPQFLSSRKHKSFKNTWIYVDACWSSLNSDFSEYFTKNGAIAYSGFKNEINISLSNMIFTNLLSRMTNEEDISHASIGVKSDEGLNRLSWLYKPFPDLYINVSYLDVIQSRTDIKYYLIDHDDIDEYTVPSYGFRNDKFTLSAIVSASPFPGNGSVWDTNNRAKYSVNADTTQMALAPFEQLSYQAFTKDLLVKSDTRLYPRTDVYFIYAYDTKGNLVSIGNTTYNILN